MSVIKVLALVVGLCALSQPVYAQDCKPLKYLGAMPIELDERGRLLVQAYLNDVPTKLTLVLSGVSSLTKSTVAKLDLKEQESGLERYDSSGEIAHTFVSVSKFAAGPLIRKDAPFLVYGDVPTTSDAMSLNMMGDNDLDFDFSAKRINLFSAEHCDGAVTYWTGGNVAIVPYDSRTTKIEIALDGHSTTANFSPTSSGETTMGLAEATETFGLTPQSPGMETYTFSSGIVGYKHVFSTLVLSGVTIKNPEVVIVPEKLNMMFKETHTVSHIAESKFKDVHISISIGKNVMRQLHIYMAKKEHKFYITPTDADAAKLLPPLPPSVSH